MLPQALRVVYSPHIISSLEGPVKSLLTLLLLVCAALSIFAHNVPNAVTSQDSKPPEAKPMRIKMGPPIVASSLLAYTQPVYPQEAKDKKVQGTVRVHVIIGTDGKIKEANAISGDSLLTQPALDAVRRWTYRPTLLNGQAMEVDS